MRLDKIAGRDLQLFDFDYDLTWAAFFLSADEKVYGRYGTRDAFSSDGLLSLKGLHHAMAAALAAHRKGGGIVPKRAAPVRVEDYPAAKRLKGGECIHCHQVYEFRRDAQKVAGLWSREDRWAYPHPENVGLTLDKDRGDRVQEVTAGSAADRAGLRAGDLLVTVNELPVASSADLQYALHRAPAKGTIPILYRRGSEERNSALELTAGWRRTNLTWRPSMLDLLPSIGVFGDDLSAAQKKALGLSERRLAFRQAAPVPDDVRTVGVREGDVILGLDGEAQEMTAEQFLAHVRRTYLVGDRVTLNLLRDGKRMDLPLTLR